MIGTNCPSSVKLTRAFYSGPSEPIQLHLRRCERCAAEWESMGQLRLLAQELPDEAPGSERKEAVRNLVLSQVDGRPYRPKIRRTWIAVAAAAMLSGLIALVVFSKNPSEFSPSRQETAARYRSVVQPVGDASFERVSAQPDEVIRLFRGTLQIDVRPLGSGEQFRVVTGNAELKVERSTFEVTVQQDQLEMVVVREGRVTVCPSREKSVQLWSGQSWTMYRAEAREEPTDLEKLTDAGVETDRNQSGIPLRRPVKRRKQPVRNAGADSVATGETQTESEENHQKRKPSSPAEIAFQQGWEALRNGRATAAAKQFERAAGLSAGNPLVEDARFWLAISYGRAGQHQRARRALRAFLATFPRSPRADEAAAILGWNLLKSGDLIGAKTHFKQALNARVPSVRESARQGLEEIEKHNNKE